MPGAGLEPGLLAPTAQGETLCERSARVDARSGRCRLQGELCGCRVTDPALGCASASAGDSGLLGRSTGNEEGGRGGL